MGLQDKRDQYDQMRVNESALLAFRSLLRPRVWGDRCTLLVEPEIGFRGGDRETGEAEDGWHALGVNFHISFVSHGPCFLREVLIESDSHSTS